MASRASNAGRNRVIILTPGRVVGLVGEVVSESRSHDLFKSQLAYALRSPCVCVECKFADAQSRPAIYQWTLRLLAYSHKAPVDVADGEPPPLLGFSAFH